MFNKILIANRGEIACRIQRTAQSLGYRTVAIYSDPDANALHVQMADEAINIGPAPVTQSYLNIEAILNAAHRTGADAIHPGYGFLSENPDFARACANAGLTFIGPSPEAIELMGSKRLSKVAMLNAGVPCIKGYQGPDQDDPTLQQQADQIGYPLMIKASAGGGGRGMRLVHSPDTLLEHLRTARSEAQNAFGSAELILEQALIAPRHVEIQLFGDTHGNLSSASLALGYRLPTTGVTLEPSLGVRVSHLNLDGFDEKDSELALDVDGMSQTRRSAFTHLKASLTPIAVAGGWQLVPGASLDYERVLGNPQVDSSAQILGLDIEQRAAYATRDQFSGALNLTANLGAVSLGAEAGATTGGDSQGFSGSLKASYRF